ncbi:P-loop containing nucleoside triphosphate hydrolase protein, partial [Pelagophyceae sp. CCMP2097]
MMRVRAAAGAGKSTALLEFARLHASSRVLYVVFNCNVQRDQAQKYHREGLDRVHVTTIDALAYNATMDVHGGRIVDEYELVGVDLNCVARDAALAAARGTIDAFVLSPDVELAAWHVPPLRRVDVDPADVLAAARQAWLGLAAGRIAMTTAVCTKVYQLKRARRDARFDLVLLDEAQDCTPVQLDAVLRLPGTAAVVAFDERQSINQWRGAVHPASLLCLRAPAPGTTVDRPLSRSFRYGDEVAALATDVFGAFGIQSAVTADDVVRGNPHRRTTVVAYADAPSYAAAQSDAGRRVAVIARTHARLFVVAFE